MKVISLKPKAQETLLKMLSLNATQAHTYMQYEDDLAKLPSKTFQHLHSKLVDLLYDYQTASVEINVDEIRTHLAMSNFPSYAVDEFEVFEEVCRLKNAPLEQYRKDLLSFRKELEDAKQALFIKKSNLLDEIIKTYVGFASSNEEKSYEDFYHQVEQLIDNDAVIKIENYL